MSVTSLTEGASRVAVDFLVACMPTPLPRRDRMGAHAASSPLDDGLPWKTDRSAPASRVFRGLRSVHSRFGLHARWATRSDPLRQRLRRICCLLRRSDCFRLERPVAGWDSHPLEVAAFARRTVLGHYGHAARRLASSSATWRDERICRSSTFKRPPDDRIAMLSIVLPSRAIYALFASDSSTRLLRDTKPILASFFGSVRSSRDR